MRKSILTPLHVETRGLFLNYQLFRRASAVAFVVVACLATHASATLMLPAPGGCFEMGDALNEGLAAERPVHTVSLSPFEIGAFEVTNEEYVAVLNWANAQGYLSVASPATANAFGRQLLNVGEYTCQISWNGTAFTVDTRDGFSMAAHPVLMVSWYGAAAYCNWLSEIEGLEPCYDTASWLCDENRNGYRLPTEAEWEYAAAWNGTRQLRYGNGSDEISCDNANFRAGNNYCNPLNLGEFTFTSPVGFYESATSPVGCFDMAGNVYEWCGDWYAGGYYGDSAAANPTGPTLGLTRVVRGGGSFSFNTVCRTARRTRTVPTSTLSDIGFRIVRRNNDDLVNFPDAALEDAVLQTLGKPGGKVYGADFACGGFTRLFADNRGIRDLTGLERAVNLVDLDISGNEITDLGPLAGLTNLALLRAKGNRIASVAPLSGLGKLRSLSLGENQISDITPLAGLTGLEALGLLENELRDNLEPLAFLMQLRTLWLDGNDTREIGPLSALTLMESLHLQSCAIADLAPLAGLTNLKQLFLKDNAVTDLAALVTNADNGGLGGGDLIDVSGNPLGQLACEEQVPRLQAKNVLVFFDSPCDGNLAGPFIQIDGPRFPVAGERVVLNTTVQGFVPLGYDWFRDNVALPGENGAILSFDPITLDDAGRYQVFVTDGAKTTYVSPPYTLIVVSAVPVGGCAALILGVIIIACAFTGGQKTKRRPAGTQ